MTTPIITVENLSKRYHLGQIGATTLRDSAQRFVHRLRGRNPDYFMGKISSSMTHQSSNSTTDTSTDDLWALRDVSFEVQPGEVLGIIGRNGAGKSTLLKILSRITEPTSGRAIIRGRVASLLEVGTGFHPELTGRENIFLNGAILGMKKAEIARKFDEIVAFAEVERFIDTPVKRYSSGMYVRLAFAVAAHLDPEVLIVDEVLAVGDVAFQEKCLGQMQSVSRGGRTVLFVSHNMQAISVLCQRCLLVDGGSISMDGAVEEAINEYQSKSKLIKNWTGALDVQEHYGSGKARFIQLNLVPMDQGEVPVKSLRSGKALRVEAIIEAYVDVERANPTIVIYDSHGYRLIDACAAMNGQSLSLRAGEKARIVVDFASLMLKPGEYLLGLWIGWDRKESIDGILHAAKFTVMPARQDAFLISGPCLCPFTFSLETMNAVYDQGSTM